MKSEDTLRCTLNRHGFKLKKRDRLYCILDLETGGTIHATGPTSNFVLDLEDVQSWTDEICAAA